MIHIANPAAASDHGPEHREHGLIRVRNLLAKQALELSLVDRSRGQRPQLAHDLVIRQQMQALRRELATHHPADIAFILENLDLEPRRQLWELVDPRFHGAVLLELSDAVRASLISQMDDEALMGAAGHLESDEIADLVPDLPEALVPKVLDRLDGEDRAEVQSALTFPEGTVGALMEFDFVQVREDVKLNVILRYLRRRGELPKDMDQLLVVDREGYLQGLLKLESLLVNAGKTRVAEVMERDPMRLTTTQSADLAADIFDRYDLIAAPVVNLHNQLVGVVKVDQVLDHIQERNQRDLLSQAGLREEEDLFAPIWHSARNRWFWLALNLVSAFLASRVIGAFEDTILQFVALATLMPIVAAVGGNTGNQTLALVIRGYALNEISPSNFRFLLMKETAIGLLNGLIWGGVMGLVTWLLYGDGLIAGIMLAAMLLNLTLASAVGALTPMLLRGLGRDPAYGSSVILTGVTDSLGFLIFLGMAAAFLP